MNSPHESNELSLTDRLVMESMSAPLAAETDARLRNKLGRLREQLRNVDSPSSAKPVHSRTTALVVMSLSLLLCAVVVWAVWLRGSGRAASNGAANGGRAPAKITPVVPPSPVIDRPDESPDDGRSPTDSSVVPEEMNLATILKDDEGYGTLTGQFVLSGTAPILPPLVNGPAAVRGFPAKCNPNIPDESLLVDRTTNGIENIVVFLPKAPATIHSALVSRNLPPVTFDATCGRFAPHVLFVQTNQAVVCRSLDPLTYNVHTLPLKNKQENFLVGPAPAPVAVTPKVAERLPFKVVDDSHPWMSAYWLVLDHPHAAITAKDGRFVIRQLPVGTHEFKVWHERVGYVNKSLSVTIESQQQTDLGVMPVTVTQMMR